MTDATDARWEGDVNEAVLEEWTAETTPFERVQEVLRSTSTPQYAGEIAERARVSEPTARTHLKRLAGMGHAETVETGKGTQYKRSRQTLATGRIAELHRELSRSELVDGIRRLRGEIDDLRERFGATGPDDLALQIEDGNAETAWGAVAEWRSLEESLDIASAALALYDFDPDASGGLDAAGTMETDRGAFASTVGEQPSTSESP